MHVKFFACIMLIYNMTFSKSSVIHHILRGWIFVFPSQMHVFESCPSLWWCTEMEPLGSLRFRLGHKDVAFMVGSVGLKRQEAFCLLITIKERLFVYTVWWQLCKSQKELIIRTWPWQHHDPGFPAPEHLRNEYLLFKYLLYYCRVLVSLHPLDSPGKKESQLKTCLYLTGLSHVCRESSWLVIDVGG